MEKSVALNRTFALTPEIIEILKLLTVGQSKPNRSKAMRDLIITEARKRVVDHSTSEYAREKITELLAKVDSQSE